MRDLKFKLGQNQCDFALVLHSGCRSWKRTCSHIKSLSVLALQDHRSRMPVYDYRQRVRLLKLEDVSWTGFTNMLAVTWTRHVPWSHSSTRFFNTSIIIDWMPFFDTFLEHLPPPPPPPPPPPTQTTYQVQFKIEQRWESKLKVPKKLRLPPEHKHNWMQETAHWMQETDINKQTSAKYCTCCKIRQGNSTQKHKTQSHKHFRTSHKTMRQVLFTILWHEVCVPQELLSSHLHAIWGFQIHLGLSDLRKKNVWKVGDDEPNLHIKY